MSHLSRTVACTWVTVKDIAPAQFRITCECGHRNEIAPRARYGYSRGDALRGIGDARAEARVAWMARYATQWLALDAGPVDREAACTLRTQGFSVEMAADMTLSARARAAHIPTDLAPAAVAQGASALDASIIPPAAVWLAGCEEGKERYE